MKVSLRPGGKCPYCGTANTHPSRIHGWEGVVRRLGVKPYRCAECQSRFWWLGNEQLDRVVVLSAPWVASGALLLTYAAVVALGLVGVVWLYEALQH